MLLNAEFNIGCVQTLCQKSGIYESIRDAEFVYGIKCAHESLNKDEDLNKMLRDSIRKHMLHKAHCSEKKAK